MSRSIASSIIEKLEGSEIITFHLLEMTIDGSTYRYTDCEVPIHTATDSTTSYTFSPRPFVFDSVSFSDSEIVDSCIIRVDNLDSVLTALFLDNVIIEEIGKVHVCVMNEDGTVLGVQNLFNGYLNDFELDETELRITITSIFSKWNQSSYGRHSSLCRWKKFKGTECSYSGGETKCDRTYARCVELSNTDNFGGFRWLPSIEDLEIWWGPRPSERRAELK